MLAKSGAQSVFSTEDMQPLGYLSRVLSTFESFKRAARSAITMLERGSKSGSQRWALTVEPTIVPRPDTGVGLDDRLRQ